MVYENVHRNKFHQELVDAGIKVISASSINDSPIGVNIIFEEGTDMNRVQMVIDAHDPTPIPTPPSEIEQLRLDQAQANAELVQLIMMVSGGTA